MFLIRYLFYFINLYELLIFIMYLEVFEELDIFFQMSIVLAFLMIDIIFGKKNILDNKLTLLYIQYYYVNLYNINGYDFCLLT